jgi:uncharacterized repeat protein (TIGR03803 family)
MRTRPSIGVVTALLATAAALAAQEKAGAAAALAFSETGQQLNQAVGRGVALGDLNGDGALDAFVVNQDAYRVYFGDGHGRFADGGPQRARSADEGGDPVFVDVNDDGRAEVVTGCTIWLVDAQGNLAPEPLAVERTEDGNLGTTALADLNGDGHVDLFALRNFAAARVYLNDGHGRFCDTGQRLGDGTIGKGELAQIALGDLDGNGTIDAITAGWRWNGSTECPNHVWLNDGTGRFGNGGQPLDEGESHVHGLTLADLNDDGWLDLVMALQDRNRSGRVFLNDGHGRLIAGQELGGAGGESAVLADFDRDGTPDVFMAQSTPPNRVWLNDGRGNFRDSGVRLGSNCCWDAAAGDFNGDGKPDVVVAACTWARNGLTPAPAQVWLNTTTARGAEPVTQAGDGGLRIPYPGNRLPGATPDVFAPGLLAREDSAALNLSFTRDGKTIYFRRTKERVNTTMVTRFEAERWTEPEAATAFPSVPVFTASGKAYYETDEGIFVKEPTAGGRSDGRLVMRVANAGPRFSVADSGNIYIPIADPANAVPGVFEIHVIRSVDGVYQAPEKLPGSICSEQTKQHLFVAPDESYILFDSDRGLNLSVRNPDGSWSPSRGLGAPLNTRTDWSGSVSPDGLGLFYYSQSDNQLHWLAWPALLQPMQQRLLAPAAADATLEFGGTALGNVTPHDLMMVSSSVPDCVEEIRRAGRTIPEQVNTLLTAARAAGSAGDRYRAYRLFARAIGWACGADQIEASEVAASFGAKVNRAIFAEGETITLELKPLFELGHQLANTYIAESWLETAAGVVPGTERQIPVTGLKALQFDHPVGTLPEGEVAVGYRLKSPAGATLAELNYTVAVAKGLPAWTGRLRARLATLQTLESSPDRLVVRDTLEHCLQSLEFERTRFDGHWRRTAHPFGMSQRRLTAIALGQVVDDRRQPVTRELPLFYGRVRFPADLALVDSLAEAVGADSDALRHRSGDMGLAFRTTSSPALLHYRLFVPDTIARTPPRGLVVALHSGEGDSGYLDLPAFQTTTAKTMQQLAEEMGFIIAVPNGERGFTGNLGERDILDLMDRVQSVYSIEPSRTFLLGWSLGGSATWRFAMRNPGRLAGMASVTGAAEWINEENTRTATGLPVLHCEPEQDQFSERAARTKAQATTLLRNFTFKSYAGADHLSVWHKALPDVFAFFEARLADSGQAAKDNSAITPAPYRILHHFTGVAGDGAQPLGSLIQSGSALFGMTRIGGIHGNGAIFRINTDGTDYRQLHSFVSAADGQRPYGALLLVGSTLYGMAASENTSAGGILFRIGVDGTGFQTLHKFAGPPGDGRWPYDSLILSDSRLYGMTVAGGNGDLSASGGGFGGTVFRINLDGSGYEILHHFRGGANDGQWSAGNLTLLGTTLYGITFRGGGGGGNRGGTIFKVNTDGTGFGLLRGFAGGTDDSTGSHGSLIFSGSALYGTGGGGAKDLGTIFRINPDGTGFALLHSFAGGDDDGAGPGNSLIQSGTFFYGMTGRGGLNDQGTVYRINTDGTDFRLLHRFAGGAEDGASPSPGPLLLSGSTLCGMTTAGGRGGQGVIFALDLAEPAPSPAPSAAASVSFTENGQRLGTGDTWYARLVDINGDGRLDAYFEGTVWLNDGRGHFAKTDQSFGPANAPAHFADLNSDGFVDVVCGNRILLNDGKNHFVEKGALASDVPMLAACLADVSGDGQIDIIVLGQTDDRLFLNDGHGSFSDTKKSLGGWGQCSYAVGDVNGDGRPDIYVAIPHTPPPRMGPTKDRLWMGDGRGGFTEGTHAIPPGEHRGVIMADLNGDGSPDLLLGDPRGGRAWLNDGKGNFTDGGQRLGGGGVVAGDFNGDGSLDAFFHAGAPTDDGKPNTVWLNDGQGRFADSGLRLGNANSVAAAVGDLNGDGSPDVFVANVKNVVTRQGDGFNEVWLNTTHAVQSGKDATPAASATAPTSFVCDYLGETPPGDEPVVFGRGAVSVEGKNTHALQFSPDGRMLIFSRYPDRTSYVMRRGPDGWSQPERTSFTGKEVSFDAASRRLYFYAGGGDLFWVRYSDDGFSEPTRLGAKINTPEAEYYSNITARGNLFFSRNSKWDQGRLMIAPPAGDDFAAPVDLGDQVNRGGASHGFVAPDESYILFNSPRTGSHTKNDIWVTFRESSGAWSAPVNLGPRINFDAAAAMLCPTVSPDGKYLFFTRLQLEQGGTGLVYWVSMATIPALHSGAAATQEEHK